MAVRICWLFLLLALLAVPAYADPVVVAFNPVPGNQEYFTPYTEQGFNFCCNVRIMRFHLLSEPTNYVVENNSSHYTRPHTITIDYGGGTFDFLGVDYRFSHGQTIFRGSNGATYVFSTSMLYNTTVNFGATFTGITWLEWTHYGLGGDPGIAPILLDNFRFNTHPETVPTPEPATLLLLGSGLLGVMKAAGKRRRA
jgi:ribosomal protein L32